MTLLEALKESPSFANIQPAQLKEAVLNSESQTYQQAKSREEYVFFINEKLKKIRSASKQKFEFRSENGAGPEISASDRGYGYKEYPTMNNGQGSPTAYSQSYGHSPGRMAHGQEAVRQGGSEYSRHQQQFTDGRVYNYQGRGEGLSPQAATYSPGEEYGRRSAMGSNMSGGMGNYHGNKEERASDHQLMNGYSQNVALKAGMASMAAPLETGPFTRQQTSLTPDYRQFDGGSQRRAAQMAGAGGSIPEQPKSVDMAYSNNKSFIGNIPQRYSTDGATPMSRPLFHGNMDASANMTNVTAGGFSEKYSAADSGRRDLGSMDGKDERNFAERALFSGHAQRTLPMEHSRMAPSSARTERAAQPASTEDGFRRSMAIPGDYREGPGPGKRREVYPSGSPLLQSEGATPKYTRADKISWMEPGESHLPRSSPRPFHFEAPSPTPSPNRSFSQQQQILLNKEIIDSPKLRQPNFISEPPDFIQEDMSNILSQRLHADSIHTPKRHHPTQDSPPVPDSSLLKSRMLENHKDLFDKHTSMPFEAPTEPVDAAPDNPELEAFLTRHSLVQFTPESPRRWERDFDRIYQALLTRSATDKEDEKIKKIKELFSMQNKHKSTPFIHPTEYCQYIERQLGSLIDFEECMLNSVAAFDKMKTAGKDAPVDFNTDTEGTGEI